MIAAPLADTPDELAQPFGEVRDWKAGECEPIPGRTMPKLVVVERDYPATLDRWLALGPLVEKPESVPRASRGSRCPEVEALGRRNGVWRSGRTAGRPRLARDRDWCEAILALSGVTNGGSRSSFRARGAGGRALPTSSRNARTSSSPSATCRRSRARCSPRPSGRSGRQTRRYSPFTVNVDRNLPWRTLTGRQHLYLDHEWLLEFGEGLPVYRPPLDVLGVGDQFSGEPGRAEVQLRFLTPHSSIHSEFQDNLTMLTLFRGGPTSGSRRPTPSGSAPPTTTGRGRATATARSPAAPSSHTAFGGDVPHVPRAGSPRERAPLGALRHRGGTDNSVTRISIKPTLLVGGYAQLSWGFNYYGATGPQRDEIVVVRKMKEVAY